MQDMLYAQDRWAVLLIFQAMDAAGKDGAIKHVMSGVNPQGCQVASFKAPSAEELDHDYLWRCMRRLPERGRIGIFNRSYYEEVLVVRVHPELLQQQKLPPELVDDRHLEASASGTSAPSSATWPATASPSASSSCTSRRRSRSGASSTGSSEPEKNWKFSAGDVAERAHWKTYMKAYEEVIRDTADAARAVVRGPGRQQVVHADGGGGRRDRRPRRAGPRLPAGGQGAAGGPGGRGEGAALRVK